MNKGDNSGIVRLVIIVLLATILIIGNNQIKDNPETLTRLSMDSIRGNGREFLRNFFNFQRNYNKVSAVKLNKEIKNNIIPSIESANESLQRKRAEEQALQNEINSIPTSEYVHTKMELSSFMVEKLKEQELVYEIDYNYSGQEGMKKLAVKEVPEEGEQETEEPETEEPETETEEEQEVVYADKFKITVYKINEGENYKKLNQVLESIFIQEPYEISGVKMEYSELTRCYTLSFIVEV